MQPCSTKHVVHDRNPAAGVLTLTIPSPCRTVVVPSLTPHGSSSSIAGVGGGGEGEEEACSSKMMTMGGGFHAHWDASFVDRPVQQQPDMQFPPVFRPPSADAGFPTTERHHGRASTSPPALQVPAAAPLAQPPPPPPPPVLSAAQLEHLRLLQRQREWQAQRQQQHGGAGAPAAMRLHLPAELALPSPSGHRNGHARDPHPALRDPPPRLLEELHWPPHGQSPQQRQQHQEQHQQYHHTRVGSPRPNYAAAAPIPAGRPPPPPYCPSPIVSVPIFRTLQEAIQHQQRHQHQQPHQCQSQTGSAPFVLPPPPPPSPAVSVATTPHRRPPPGFEGVPVTPRPCFSPRVGVDSCQRQLQQQQQHGFNDGTMPDPEGLALQQRRQQLQHFCNHHHQQQQQSGYDGAGSASPRMNLAPQDWSFQAPAPISTPSGGCATSGFMQPPAVPPADLRLQMHGVADNNPMAPPVTPVMVYASPNGYMMGYPPVSAQDIQTPRFTQSQAWDPYECVSPSGESVHAGFDERRDGEEIHAASPHVCSPAGSSSRMSILSRESSVGRVSSKPDGVDDGLSQRSCASSVRPDEIGAAGFSEERIQRNGDDTSGNEADGISRSSAARPARLSVSHLQGGENRGEVGEVRDAWKQKGAIKLKPSQTPTRHPSGTRGTSRVEAAECDDDKENSGGPGAAAARAVAEERIGHCCVGGGDALSKGSEAGARLSGQKRGGTDIEIAKQLAFTGSYFQVSPCSFLQSSKRQRNFA